MTETSSNAAQTSLWNKDAPLRVLMIENSEPDAVLNLHELERAGFRCRSRVIAARQELIDLFPRFPFDIVLADYRLPSWNGMDAFAAIREAGRDTPFILVTGFLGEELAVECIKQGITDYVLKGHLARLPLVVARALEERALRDARGLIVQALRESEANAQFLFAHNPLPMWVFDRETLHFLQVNDAATRLCGYDRSDLLQMQVTALHPSEEVQKFLTALEDSKTGGPLGGEWRLRRKDRTIVDVEMFLHKVQYSGRSCALVVTQDISERRALERQLRQAQKFEAIGQLAGGIAHDFNNVIGAILGWAELGEEQAASAHPQLAIYFNKIHSQCDRVTSLVRQLLAFSRRQILEPRSLNLNQTAQDVLNLLDKVIGKDIEIKTMLADDLMGVRADPTQIEQVLMNLCVNSRDAMRHGGRLTIETHNAEFTEQDCRRIAGLHPGRFAEFRVTDTGIGMDDSVREKIFEPFFTTKTSGKGTGLGLATAYGIVKQHGGFVLVESEPGHGSIFRIFLPAGPQAAKQENRPVVIEEAPSRGGRETVLIAEDHDALREVAHSALQKKGYQILLAADGQEAVDVFARHCETISLVILDVIMPRRSGPQVYQAVKALKPGISVLFATGYTDEAAGLSELVEQGVSILRKPYTPALLCRKVREMLDARSEVPAIPE